MKGNTVRIKWLLGILGISSLLMLSACRKDHEEVRDILTQKETHSEKTQITVLVKYAFSIFGFEKAIEEKFPEVDIVQVGNYTRDMGISEYQRRMEHDDLTDIVMTWPLEAGEEYWEERLIDLSSFDFTSRYNLSVLNSMSKAGRLYYLPGPSQVRGIVYNKTLFEEKGWKVPTDFESFIELCQTIEESGIRSIQLGFKNPEVLNTAFVGYNYPQFFSKPGDIQWISDYNDGRGSFGEHFAPALDVFQRMIDEGVWRQTDLDVDYAMREKMLFNRKCAMVEDSVLMARMGEAQTGTTDEFGVMPYFTPGGDWARLYMVCLVGLNRHLEEPVNEEKFKLVLKIMDYISTEEGQRALVSDTGAMFSSLLNAELPQVPEITDLRNSLERGRYAVFPQLKNAQEALEEGLAGMLRGDTTKEEVIELVDKRNKAPLVVREPKKLGEAEEDFSMVETGSFVADAMRSWCDSDIALFMDNGKDGLYNGKGISGSIYKGEVTEEDISCVLPDLKHGEQGILWKITMKGSDLLKTLEYSISVDNEKTGWFYYFSGIRMEYAPSKEPGSRIGKITMEDGKPLIEDKLYTIGVMDETVPEEFIVSCEEYEETIADILAETVQKSEHISPSNDGRFTILQ